MLLHKSPAAWLCVRVYISAVCDTAFMSFSALDEAVMHLCDFFSELQQNKNKNTLTTGWVHVWSADGPQLSHFV